MRRNVSSAGSTGLPTRFSMAGALLASLATSLAVVGAALAVMYPLVAAVFTAGVATATLAPATVCLLNGNPAVGSRATAVRVPFTDRHVEV